MGVHHPNRVVRQRVPSWAHQALDRGPGSARWWLWWLSSTVLGLVRETPHVVVAAARWAAARPNLVLTPSMLALFAALLVLVDT